MVKKIMALLLCCCMVLPLAACGSNTETNMPAAQGPADVAAASTTPQAASTESNVPAAADPYAPAEAETPIDVPATVQPIGYQVGGGPILIKHTATTNTVGVSLGDTRGYVDAFTLYQLDMNTKQMREIFSCPKLTDRFTSYTLNAQDGSTYCEGYGNSWKQRQLFSLDFTKLALNWIDSSDNSRHVGWIDANGEITDVTKAVIGTQSDFAKSPQHSDASFSPDGYFLYCDMAAGTTHALIPDTLQEVESVEYKKGTFVLDNTNEVIARQIAKYENDRTFYDVVCNTQTMGTLCNENFFEHTVTAGKTAILYLDNHSIRKKTEAGEKVITPETDYFMVNVVYGEGKILFTALRGEEYALFEMDDTDGVGSPTKLLDLSSDKYDQRTLSFYAYRLLCWE